MNLAKISPQDAKRLVDAGAILVDIRGADEYARESIPGARNVPFGQQMPHFPQGPVIFHCRSGMRTSANAAQLAASTGGQAYLLDGGLDAWKRAGLPMASDTTKPIEIMRQVQISAGSLVLIGILLGAFISPLFFALSGFVGAGLVFAGTTGWCGMARLLEHAPWNRRANGAAMQPAG